MYSSSREEIVEIFDALEADLERALNLSFGVLTTPSGHQIFKVLLDNNGNPPGAGALFGVTFLGNTLYYVDDATNTLNVLQ